MGATALHGAKAASRRFKWAKANVEFIYVVGDMAKIHRNQGLPPKQQLEDSGSRNQESQKSHR
jgi:hypothetical protein